ncbi:uncharacterized protein LOC129799467 [Phlebotomus papatasi]|uniref:uncharacterized protein LOC129799467 n=1 Tax=Phlebotomus papatasi TaxID=29031 RepID=UPI002483B4BB|nr:uncharacterized protein LOC129799467 [Phlebotomus papatasi]
MDNRASLSCIVLYRAKKMKILIILTVCLFSRSLAEQSHNESFHSREKRFLIFPPTAPTRHQFIFGIGIPLDLESIAVTTGYVFKAQYFLPTKPEDLRISPIWESKKTRRDLPRAYPENPLASFDGHKEVYNVDKVLVEESQINENSLAVDEEDWDWMKEDKGDNDSNEIEDVPTSRFPGNDFNIDHTRWHLYKGLEAISIERSFGGRACVLRAICETAEVPFNRKSGILAELIHIILTPSTTNEPLSQHSDNEYFRAEQIGRSGISCSREFSECSVSLLDIVTSVHDPLVDEIVKILA